MLVLVLNALVLQVSSDIVESYTVDNFGWALLAALLVSAVSVVLEVVFGANDDHTYSLAVVRRVARRQGGGERTDVPGIVYLEIDGLALPVLRRAMRDGNAPNMARWLAESTHSLAEWETDLSSQTGASQAGILLGSNEEIPAFRWVEKETATVVACSAPDDCARIEQARLEGNTGLLADGGSSRGNLLSGGADEVILTVSRIEAEKKANPGYRAFFANGFNVTRSLVLFGWEVILEWIAANRASRRDVRPRGHRGGLYPFIRAAMCVVVRDLIVYGVLTDMMRGRPAVYATFSSYDEVAHHSGLERADTLEALRKVDQQFGQIDRARRFAPRPYAIVVLSDHGQTQGATFKQRNGYGLDELVARSLESGRVEELAGGDEQRAMVGHAIGEATGAKADKKRSKTDVSDREVVVLGSGNLGLVYLMEERRRLTLEEIEQRHPRLVQALRAHPHVGWILVRSSEHGAVALGGRGVNYLSEGRVEGEDPLASFSPNAARHLLRTDGFSNVADIMVGSFFDAEAGGGLRVRGADLVPRWARRAADAGVHPPSRRAPASRGAARGGGSGPPGARSVAAAAARGRARRRARRQMNLVWAAADHRRRCGTRRAARCCSSGGALRRGATSPTAIEPQASSASWRPVSPCSSGSSSSSRSRATTSPGRAQRRRHSSWGSRCRRPSSCLRPVAAELTGELICYGRSVVHIEWPRTEDGHAGRRDQPLGRGALPHRAATRTADACARRRPTASGSTRPRNVRRPGSTESTERWASSRRRSGSC